MLHVLLRYLKIWLCTLTALLILALFFDGLADLFLKVNLPLLVALARARILLSGRISGEECSDAVVDPSRRLLRHEGKDSVVVST